MQRFYPNLRKRIDRMNQSSWKESEWKWTIKEEEDFNEIKTLITETPSLAQFARDQDKIVKTKESRTRVRITLWKRQKRQQNPTNSIRQQILG